MKEKEREGAARSKSEKRVLLLAIAAFLLSGGVLGSISYLKARANLGNYAQREPVVPDMAPELQAARLTKVKMLRDRWKPWALQHKAELKQMLAGDRSAHNVVWQALPEVAGQPNPSFGPSGDIKDEDISQGLNTFTWQPAAKIVYSEPNPATPKVNLQQENHDNQAKTQDRLNADFARYHDINLSQSSNSGAKTLSLCASGRVVEIETIFNPDKRKGQPAFKEVYHEIAPPYDFLQKGDSVS